MNYVRGGSGKTLVLLHGYPQTWFMWRTVLDVFARHHTVIAPDLRGAGGSDEQIVTGREELWVDRFIDSLALRKTRIRAAAVREYASHLTDPAHLRASFEYFRALHQDVADNVEYSRTTLPMPVLAIGARASLAESVPNQVARYGTDVTGEVIENSGHWIFEEQPEQLADRLLRFFQ